ncbi:MAG: hypothetical protein U9R16_01795 [Campylobacterota bacterium]|nr:hypothetical protein [Campylobacterota bacterium]
MKYKLLIIIALVLNCFASETKVVPVSIKSINYKEQIFSNGYKLIQLNTLNIIKYKVRCKEYLSLDKLKQNKYRAKHYIRKNSAICKKDVYISSSKKIKFNFGLLEIERDGEIIKETSKYIKIKNLDGSIEKIYKGAK